MNTAPDAADRSLAYSFHSVQHVQDCLCLCYWALKTTKALTDWCAEVVTSALAVHLSACMETPSIFIITPSSSSSCEVHKVPGHGGALDSSSNHHSSFPDLQCRESSDTVLSRSAQACQQSSSPDHRCRLSWQIDYAALPYLFVWLIDQGKFHLLVWWIVRLLIVRREITLQLYKFFGTRHSHWRAMRASRHFVSLKSPPWGCKSSNVIYLPPTQPHWTTQRRGFQSRLDRLPRHHNDTVAFRVARTAHYINGFHLWSAETICLRNFTLTRLFLRTHSFCLPSFFSSFIYACIEQKISLLASESMLVNILLSIVLQSLYTRRESLVPYWWAEYGTLIRQTFLNATN